MFEEEAPKKPKDRVLGADLSTFSVGDLREYIDELQAEIGRVREELGRKQAAMGGAEALFGRKAP